MLRQSHHGDCPLKSIINFTIGLFMKITFLDGPYKGKKFEINSPKVTIGRDGGNQLILDTDGVSRCHAEFQQLPDGSWIVRDLNSTNGVKIAGVRIDGTAVLNENFEVTIGENLIRVSDLRQEPARVIFNPIISTPQSVEPASPSLPQGGAVIFNSSPASAPAPAPEKAAEPVPVASPVPPVVPAAEKTAPAIPSTVDIKKLSGSLFGQKKKSAGNSGEEKSADGAGDAKKRRSNMIFYTIVACVVIMVLSAAFSIMNPRNKTTAAAKRPQPLTLRYEKEVVTKGNVFRFDFLLKSKLVKKEKKSKDGKKYTAYEREYFVDSTIDDIASQRHFTRTVPVSDETAEELRSVIRDSGIFTNESENKGGSDAMNRRLTIVDGKRLLECSVPGEFASTEFNAVEEAVVGVAKTFGLETISMTPGQLIAQAEKYFINANDLYDNRRAAAGNLQQAIKYYKAVTNALEQFSPRPPMWDQARTRLAEAEKERNTELDALETEYKRLAQLRQFAEMKSVFLKMMDLTDPESREHSAAKRRLIIIEQMLRKRK